MAIKSLWDFPRENFEKRVKITLYPLLNVSVERYFLTKAGLPAVIIKNSMMGHCCAYICLGEGSREYEEMVAVSVDDILVHGGFTYISSSELFTGNLKPHLWVGWDYAHAGDWTMLTPHGREHSIESIIDTIEDTAYQLIEKYHPLVKPIT